MRHNKSKQLVVQNTKSHPGLATSQFVLSVGSLFTHVWNYFHFNLSYHTHVFKLHRTTAFFFYTRMAWPESRGLVNYSSEPTQGKPTWQRVILPAATSASLRLSSSSSSAFAADCSEISALLLPNRLKGASMLSKADFRDEVASKNLAFGTDGGASLVMLGSTRFDFFCTLKHRIQKQPR